MRPPPVLSRVGGTAVRSAIWRSAAIAGHMELATSLGAVALIALLIGAVWGNGPAVAAWVGFAVLVVPLNACISLVFLPRWGTARAEAFRAIMNVSAGVFAAHYSHWPMPSWLWLPFIAIALDKIDLRTALAVLVVSCAVEDVWGLIDGVPWIYPLSFSVLAFVCWEISWIRLRTVESMLLRADEQHLELERAHADARVANAHLQRGEANLQSVIESTTDYVYSLNPELRIVTMNTAMRNAHTEATRTAPVVGERLSGCDAAATRYWDQLALRALRGERVSTERSTVVGGVLKYFDISVNPISEGRLGVTVFMRDITARRRQEQKLQAIHKQMIELSHQAGMAEVATGILHNVGNILNSVNVSAHALRDQLPRSRFSGLDRAVSLLEEHAGSLGEFMTQDPKGRQLPKYLRGLCLHLEAELLAEENELGQLIRNIEHIKSIVALQQNHARTMGMVETVPVAEIIDDAVRLNGDGLRRNGIEWVVTHSPLEVTLERHKVLQILVNLLSNASHALGASGKTEKRLEIRVLSPSPERFQIQVSENGIGISPENLPRLFTQGFTTKSDGHGFGLHMCSLTAKALGGTLTCRSDGQGLGATFTLDLPVDAQRVPVEGAVAEAA